ncbi:hypothetical protein [Curtobacterium sp. MCSS17_016]|uniref:hypothetical protein n=1 Tax=Curtobacterium sp. MCSS17_016 TaxID=2175644 RepID=UPI000DA9AC86|nr:hypothetical protein [Curtobacterium sp. MCSS17_016]WIE80972.1 hypothetical protein DEJ19_020865 [Curtobacterium sp. MCSS17_016]
MKAPSKQFLSVAAIAVLSLTLAGCSGSDGGKDTVGTASKASLPTEVSKVASFDSPNGMPAGLTVTLGRDDKFVSAAALKAGARGAVVMVSNTSADDVKIGGNVYFGDAATRGNWDGYPNELTLKDDQLPTECKGQSGGLNNAYLGSSAGSSITIKAGEAVYGCAILGQEALPKDGDITVVVNDKDKTDIGTTVAVGDKFTS